MSHFHVFRPQLPVPPHRQSAARPFGLPRPSTPATSRQKEHLRALTDRGRGDSSPFRLLTSQYASTPETTASWRRREATSAGSPLGPRPSPRRRGGVSDEHLVDSDGPPPSLCRPAAAPPCLLLGQGHEVHTDVVRRRACPSSSGVHAGIVRRKVCPFLLRGSREVVREKACPSPSEVQTSSVWRKA